MYHNDLNSDISKPDQYAYVEDMLISVFKICYFFQVMFKKNLTFL